MKFENRVVVLTGAAGNLAGAVIQALRGSGARLALFDHRKGRLAEMYPELSGDAHCLFVESVDLTDEIAVQNGLDQVIDRFGQVDVLINAAGGYSGGKSLEETTIDTWERMLDLNARTVFITSRAVVPTMRNQGGGSIVNVGARPGVEGVKNAAAYSASKSAVLRLTESLSAEVKHAGIHVNAVMPGTIDTPQNREAMPDANFDRWVEPAAIADVILFLASDAARGIYGALVPVYGAS